MKKTENDGSENNKKARNLNNSGSIIHLPGREPQKETVHSFGAVLQKYRVQNEMSQPELAEIMGTSRNTITNWETDKSKPDFEATRQLCTMLGIPLYELYGIENTSLPSPQESIMLKQFRQISQVNQKVVNKMIATMLQEELDARNDFLRDSFFIIPFQSTPVAAGPGCAFNDIPAEPMFVKRSSVNQHADAVVRVSGKSMEPKYHNNDYVYIMYTSSADDEEDVVCSTADGAVIKRYRDRMLYSLNPKYPYGMKSDDDNVQIIGRVLGIVEDEDLPDDEDMELLDDLFSRERREFYKEHGE